MKMSGAILAVMAASVAMHVMASCASGNAVGSDSDTTAVATLDSVQAEHDVSVDAYAWADSVADSMTLEQMSGQLIMPAVYADDGAPAMRLLRRYATDSHIGGVVLLKGTPEGARAIADSLRQWLQAPPFIALDAEWGLAMRLEGTPEFPRNGRISEFADESLLFDYGREVARECRELGINMVLGPVLDVLPEKKMRSVIGSRSFGRSAARVANLGVAYAKGVESYGLISVAKHFPGHGSADADSHKRLPIVTKSRQELDSVDLMPFRRFVDNGLSAIMTGHLYVPSLEAEEEPVSVSPKVLRDFLREELGFRGLVITDAINMAGASGYSAADAVIAGADIVLAPANTEGEVKAISEAVRSGRLPLNDIRDRVRRVLFYKYMMAKGEKEPKMGKENGEAERIIKLLR